MPLEIYETSKPTTTVLKWMAAIPKNADLCQKLVTYTPASATMVMATTIAKTPRLEHRTISPFADGRGRCQQRAVSLKEKEKVRLNLRVRFSVNIKIVCNSPLKIVPLLSGRL